MQAYRKLTINTTVGDLAGNLDLMLEAARRSAAGGAGLVIFPELSLTGYPPRDLVEKPSFLERTEEQLQRLAAETARLDSALVCGYVGRSTALAGKTATNNAAVLDGGKIQEGLKRANSAAKSRRPVK